MRRPVSKFHNVFCLRLPNDHDKLKIVHHLPEYGHSFLANNRDFGDAEKKTKGYYLHHKSFRSNERDTEEEPLYNFRNGKG